MSTWIDNMEWSYWLIGLVLTIDGTLSFLLWRHHKKANALPKTEDENLVNLASAVLSSTSVAQILPEPSDSVVTIDPGQEDLDRLRVQAKLRILSTNELHREAKPKTPKRQAYKTRKKKTSVKSKGKKSRASKKR